MKLFRNPRGSVSIFLVIILVPMLTVSALFVDASKLMLAKGVAVSAGDLALNTALTNYDTKLKDLYGLFATAQDMDDLFGKLEDYYRTCITSSGVDDAEAEGLTDRIMAQLGLIAENNDTADILNMNLVDFGASKVDSATLANAAVLKRQIVDFMKYRAPINTGLEFLSALQSFTTLSKQTELVEKRQAYYEEEEGVMRKAYEAWNEINEYNKSAFITDKDYFQKMKDKFDGNASGGMESYRQTYEKIAVKIIKDLYHTQNYVDFNAPELSIKEEEIKMEVETEEEETEEEETGEGTEESEEESEEEAGTEEKKFVTITVPCLVVNGVEQDNFTSYSTYRSDKKPDADQIKKALTQYHGALVNFESAQENFLTAYALGEALVHYKDPGSQYTVYGLQYLVQVNREAFFQKWGEAFIDLYKKYNELRHVAWYADESDMLNNFITIGEGSPSDSYDAYYQDYIKVFDLALPESSAKLFLNEYQEYRGILNEFAAAAADGNMTNDGPTRNRIDALYNEIKGYKDTIDVAKEHLEKAVKCLREVYDGVKTGGTLDGKKEEWSVVANNSQLKNHSMAKQDQAEIESLNEYLDPEDVNKLITRIENIIPHLEALGRQIDSYTFFDRKIAEINGYDTLIGQIESKIGVDTLESLPFYEIQLNHAISNGEETGLVDGKFQTGEPVDITWNSQEGEQADIAAGSQKPAFYSYLYSKFNTGSTNTELKKEDEDNGKNLYNNIKTQSSNKASEMSEEAIGGNDIAAKDADGNEREVKSQPNLPSAGKSGNTPCASEVKPNEISSASKNLSGMMGSLASAIMNFGTGLRDRLYVSDYILNMFSYDTIEAEFNEKQKESGSGGSGKEEQAIQTLTLAPINKEHNYAYGREVEYILYGGSNSGNVTKAYASIYAIRLAFNLVYAFMNSETRDTALAVATPISAATLGIIPVPLIQSVIIIAVACCESALDLTLLKKGEEVPLYKNEESWHFSVSGMVRFAKNEAEELLEDAAKKAIDKSAQELGKVLNMADGEMEEYISGHGEELKKNIEDAYDKMITEHMEAVIQKMTSLVEQAVDEFADETENTIAEKVKKSLNDWLNQESAGGGSSDIAFVVRKETVNLLVETGSKYIEEYVHAVKDAGENIKESVNNMGAGIMGKIEGIKSAISAKLNEGIGVVTEYKNRMKAELEESINEGADKLKETVSKNLGNVFGSGSGDGDLNPEGAESSNQTGLASLLSFSYSDYLRLFLMIGLYTNEEALLLRTADVIQVNMDFVSKAENKDAPAFLMKQAGVYVKITATVQVKPTLLALPLFSETGKSVIDNTNCYTINYTDYRGY